MSKLKYYLRKDSLRNKEKEDRIDRKFGVYQCSIPYFRFLNILILCLTFTSVRRYNAYIKITISIDVLLIVLLLLFITEKANNWYNHYVGVFSTRTALFGFIWTSRYQQEWITARDDLVQSDVCFLDSLVQFLHSFLTF